MKKIKFLGIIAILAVICLFITSCEFGGSLTIRNQTGYPISAQAISLGTISDAFQTISANGSYTWTFGIDTDVSWSWQGVSGGVKTDSGKITIKGGKSEVITAK